MNLEQRYNELPNTMQGELQKIGDDLIQYLENTDELYVTSSQIQDQTSLDADPRQIGYAMTALQQLYGQALDYHHETETDAKWMPQKTENLDLQQLKKQVLEP